MPDEELLQAQQVAPCGSAHVAEAGWYQEEALTRERLEDCLRNEGVRPSSMRPGEGLAPGGSGCSRCWGAGRRSRHLCTVANAPCPSGSCEPGAA